MTNLFDLTGKVAVVTGGSGFLGLGFCRTLLDAGASVALLDLKVPAGQLFEGRHWGKLLVVRMDVTDADRVADTCADVTKLVGPPDILINNAAINPVAGGSASCWHEGFADWEASLDVGLTGAYFCSRAFGAGMAQRGHGTIVNIASEYSVSAPDQRLYRKPGLLEHQQPIKPSSYSVVKHGLVGLTRWLATRWAAQGVRVNCLSPGGVANGQPAEFVERYTNTIPLGRMATPADLQGALLFLCSDASQFVTGHNLVVDGGRSCW